MKSLWNPPFRSVSRNALSGLAVLGAGLVLWTAQLRAADQPSLESSPVPPQGLDRARQETENGKLERVVYDVTAVAAGFFNHALAPDWRRAVKILLPATGMAGYTAPYFSLVVSDDHGQRANWRISV